MNQRTPIPKSSADGRSESEHSPLTTHHSPLTDSFGRRHNNLRISVTDRCNLRCTYCMPEDVTFLDKNELLSFEEMGEFVRVVAPLGIDKIRLTGGEPLLRRDLHVLVRMLLAIPGVHDIGLTTNGLLLAAQAPALFEAGLRRINVSLDTLDPERFHRLARRDGLAQVLDGLAAAKSIGFERIKVNAVILRGVNDVDIAPLGRAAREHGWELRFIECMPIGAEPWERQKAVLAHEILEVLEREIGPLHPAHDYDPHAPAMDFQFADGIGRVGFIASISRPFCRQCNRLRLTDEGKLRNCLFALDEIDVKPFLRPTIDAEQLADAVRANVAAKWEGHEINSARFVKPLRTMHAIGG
jgi:cyclic pyranopterin phosphate synthase